MLLVGYRLKYKKIETEGLCRYRSIMRSAYLVFLKKELAKIQTNEASNIKENNDEWL